MPEDLSPEQEKTAPKIAETIKLTVDWTKYLAVPPPRADIDPEGKLSPEGVAAKINEYFKAQGLTIKTEASFDVTEYPELIDEPLRSLTQRINKSDFIRTYSSCAGHIHEAGQTPQHEREQVGRFAHRDTLTYLGPYLSLLVVRKNASSQIFLEGLEQQKQQYVQKYPNAFINLEREILDLDIEQVTFSLELGIPESWIEKNGKKTTEQLNQEITDAKKRLGVVDPPQARDFSDMHQYEQANEAWEKKHQESYEKWHEEYFVGLYRSEYGDFFKGRTSQAEVQDFFAGIRGALDQVRP